MLRFERRQIAADVIEGVTPYVQAFEARYGGLPPGYWEDEYVLGFVPALAGLFAHAISRGQIGAADQLAVVRECIDTLSRGFAVQIMPQIDRLMLTTPPDFVTGGQAANKVMAFSLGQFPADDPEILKARDIARQELGGTSPDPAKNFAATAKALVHMLFYDVVNLRLMGNTEIPETDSTASPPIDPGFSIKF